MGVDPRVAVPPEGKAWLLKITNNPNFLNLLCKCFERNYNKMIHHPSYTDNLVKNDALFIDLVKHDSLCKEKIIKVNIFLSVKATFFDMEQYINLLYGCLEEYRSFIKDGLPSDSKVFVKRDAKKAVTASIVCRAFSEDYSRNSEILSRLSSLKHERNLVAHADYDENRRLFIAFNFIYDLRKFIRNYSTEIKYMINSNDNLDLKITPKEIEISRIKCFS